MKNNLEWSILDAYSGRYLCSRKMEILSFKDRNSAEKYIASKNLSPETFRAVELGGARCG